MFSIFFTVPSQLGRRMSMVDPLGFRGVATHFLHRVAPGFTGRVRGRTWFPILCWAAQVLAEKETEHGYGSDEEPRVQIRRRRASMATLERALRLAAMLTGEIKDGPGWRYGNRVQWWERNRKDQIRTTYREADKPPFFSSRSSEIASNALGCLRRSLERHVLFFPSENRFSGGAVDVLPSHRYRPTDRGRELAQAFEQDLRSLRADVSRLEEWGLYPDRIGRRFKNDQERETALKKMAPAIPVLPDGQFDRERFGRSAACMDRLFQAERDPLFPDEGGCGPMPATVVAFQAHPDAHPVDVFAAVAGDDPWSKRLRDANATLSVLMGHRVDGAPSLFEILGQCFVAGAVQAFPHGALDCPKFEQKYAGFAPDDMRAAYPRVRSAYLRAWDTLQTSEKHPSMGFLPRVESVVTESVDHFNEWLEEAAELSFEKVLDLHLDMPRFRDGRVLPLVERDAGGAFLDEAFPWSSVEIPVSEGESGHESDISDTEEAFAESEADEAADAGRYLITDYWRTAIIARRVLLGQGN